MFLGSQLLNVNQNLTYKIISVESPAPNFIEILLVISWLKIA
jgi:hypothetical protein